MSSKILRRKPIEIDDGKYLYEFKTLLCCFESRRTDPSRTIKIVNPSVIVRLDYGEFYINGFHPHASPPYPQDRLSDEEHDGKIYRPTCMGSFQIPEEKDIKSPNDITGYVYSYLTCWNGGAGYALSELVTLTTPKEEIYKCVACKFQFREKSKSKLHLCMSCADEIGEVFLPNKKTIYGTDLKGLVEDGVIKISNRNLKFDEATETISYTKRLGEKANEFIY